MKTFLKIVVLLGLFVAGWVSGRTHERSEIDYDDCRAASIDYSNSIRSTGTPEERQRQAETFEIYKKVCYR